VGRLVARPAEYRIVGGQLKRSKKVLAIRGLNRNHNHDLKNIFKGAATWAASNHGAFQTFYEACVAKGMKPHMARLTLARKIAAITLLVWKKGVRFDAEHLKNKQLERRVKDRPLLDSFLVTAFRFFRRSGSRVSLHNRVRRSVCFTHHESLD
jgi:hypothetical protein